MKKRIMIIVARTLGNGVELCNFALYGISTPVLAPLFFLLPARKLFSRPAQPKVQLWNCFKLHFNKIFIN